jgi:hypothetical protein
MTKAKVFRLLFELLFVDGFFRLIALKKPEDI